MMHLETVEALESILRLAKEDGLEALSFSAITKGDKTIIHTDTGDTATLSVAYSLIGLIELTLHDFKAKVLDSLK